MIDIDWKKLKEQGQLIRDAEDEEERNGIAEKRRVDYVVAVGNWKEKAQECKQYQEFIEILANHPNAPQSSRLEPIFEPFPENVRLFNAAMGDVRRLIAREDWRQVELVRCIKAFGERYATCDMAQIIKRTEIDKTKSVILAGGVGVGKTTSMIYHVLHMIEAASMNFEGNYPTFVFYRAGALFDLLFNADVPIPDEVMTADYLVIDDLGREYSTAWPLHRFEELVEDRYSSNRGFILTTNMDRKAFEAREGWERINDRLLQLCSWIDVPGKSKRQRG